MDHLWLAYHKMTRILGKFIGTLSKLQAPQLPQLHRSPSKMGSATNMNIYYSKTNYRYRYKLYKFTDIANNLIAQLCTM